MNVKIESAAKNMRIKKTLSRLFENANKLYDLGKYRQSKRLFEKLIKLCHARYDKKDKIFVKYVPWSYQLLGFISAENENHKKVLAYHFKALESVGFDEEAKVSCLGDIGFVYSLAGDYIKAFKYLKKSKNLAARIGDKEGKNIAQMYLGYVYLDLSEYKKALKIFNVIKKYFKKAEDRIGLNLDEGYAYFKIAEDENREANHKLAYQLFNKAYKISKKSADSFGISYSLYHLGLLEERRRNYIEAIKYYKEGLLRAKKIESNALRADFELGLGAAMLSGYQNEQEGVMRLNRSISIFKKLGDRSGVVYGFGIIGEYMLRKRRFNEAYHNLKKCVDTDYREKSEIPKVYQSSATRPNIRYYTALIRVASHLRNRNEIVRTAHRIAVLFA